MIDELIAFPEFWNEHNRFLFFIPEQGASSTTEDDMKRKTKLAIKTMAQGLHNRAGAEELQAQSVIGTRGRVNRKPLIVIFVNQLCKFVDVKEKGTKNMLLGDHSQKIFRGKDSWLSQVLQPLRETMVDCIHFIIEMSVTTHLAGPQRDPPGFEARRTFGQRRIVGKLFGVHPKLHSHSSQGALAREAGRTPQELGSRQQRRERRPRRLGP